MAPDRSQAVPGIARDAGTRPENEPRAADARVRRLIDGAIAALGLDLRGHAVLTEAATGQYRLTASIAALAGADPVLMLARDSAYGSAAEAREATLAQARAWGVAERLLPLDGRDDPRIARADVVTNLGFVRPLDEPFLARLGSGAAIALMWETWEHRAADLDLEAARRHGIPVLGTNERHPAVATLRYVGMLAVRLLLDAEIECVRSTVVVAGSDPFAAAARGALEAAGARVASVDTRDPGALASVEARDAIGGADALVVLEHTTRRPLVGRDGDLAATALAALNPGLVVAHVAGSVDRAALVDAGLRCVPSRFAAAGYMSVTTAYLGPRPLVDLHAAGLRVGQLLAEARRGHPDPADAEAAVLAVSDLAQAFGEPPTS